jgi:hypothetical protein
VEWIQSVSVIEILVFDIARDCSEEVNFLSLKGERTKVRVRVRVRVRSGNAEFPLTLTLSR